MGLGAPGFSRSEPIVVTPLQVRLCNYNFVNHHYKGNPVEARPDEEVVYNMVNGQNAQVRFCNCNFLNHHYKGNPVEAFPDVPETNDTVSAVAMDAMGHLACATSTGTCQTSFLNICFNLEIM